MVNDTEHLEISIEEDKGKPPTDGHPTDLSMICISMLLVLLQGKSRPKRRTDMRRDGIHQGILSPNQMVIQVSTGSLDQVMTPGSKAPADKPARTSPPLGAVSMWLEASLLDMTTAPVATPPLPFSILHQDFKKDSYFSTTMRKYRQNILHSIDP